MMRFFDIIVATSINNAIGEKGGIPWKLPSDLKWFQKITTSSNTSSKNIIIMGRKTWESLPKKPLPNRIHFIITRNKNYEILNYNDVYTFETVDTALKASIEYANTDVFVIGGAEIYTHAIANPWCRYIYRTVVQNIYPGADKFFPDVSSIDKYDKIYTSKQFEENNINYNFEIWTRRPCVLWWTDKDCYEYDWINSCLSNIPKIHIEDKECQQCIPNAIIVTNQLIVREDNFRAYKDGRVPFHLIHLSDEYLDDRYNVYEYDMCKTVHRNYFHPFIRNKAITFGIGPKSNFWKGIEESQIDLYRNKSYQERPYVWSFAGYIKKSDRTLVCDMFKILGEHFVYSTQGFNRGIMTTVDYRDKLLQSKFVLCPIGNCSLDTFRIYEALEAGAIPVTLYTNVNQGFIRYIDNYWKYIFYTDKLPFVVSNSWEENLEKVRYLLNNPTIYETLRKEMNIFWMHYKGMLTEHFMNILTPELHLRPPRNILDIIEL